MTVTARKYNPGFLTDDELAASFCVRTDEFESMVEVLRECTGSANTHQIVIGPRGSGKTSLLLRIAVEIRRDESLSGCFFPIVFAEESYEVSTVGEFWLECLSRLAGQAPSPEDGPELHRTYEDLSQIRDDRTLGDRCLGALQDFADREGKRLVLVVENLNMLLKDIGEDDAAWRLRQTFQTEPRILLLASATSRFEEIDNPDKAFFELFRVLPLRPLDKDDCATLWQAVSGRCRAPETIQALRILTGGSPRLLAIVARFGADLSFRELMADLLDLVDDHTEYFKSHLDSLPAQERKVYLALAHLWKPATAREIAHRARLDTSQCSAHLKRLNERGVVEVAGGTVRRKLYYVAERLYNIYYLLRRARGQAPLIEALIRFMQGWYSVDELKEFGATIAHEATDLDDRSLGLYRMAFLQLVRLPALEAHRQELFSLAPTTFGDLAADIVIDPASSSAAENLVAEACALVEQGRLEHAVDAWDEVIERFAASDSVVFSLVVAMALLGKGISLALLNRPDEAIAMLEDAIHRYEESDARPVDHAVALAMGWKSIALTRLERFEEALSASSRLVDRFGQCEAPKIVEQVAIALENKTDALLRLNRLEEALDVSNEVIRRFGGNHAPEILDAVATTLVNKATALFRLYRVEEALEVWSEVERRFGADESSRMQDLVKVALLGQAAVELVKGRTAPAIAAVDGMFQKRGARSPEIDWLAHMLRAEARLAGGDVAAGVGDVEAMLAVLPRLDAFPKEVLDGLSRIAVALGEERTRDLIQASPAADLLLPLTTALEKSLGEEPRVAKEVEEVAEDIRRDLEELRKSMTGNETAEALEPETSSM